MRAGSIALPLLIAVCCPVQAQGPSQTGTGDGPRSTVTAPNTVPSGRTKPPGAAAGPSTADDRETRTKTEKRGDSIDSGICIGCNK